MIKYRIVETLKNTNDMFGMLARNGLRIGIPGIYTEDIKVEGSDNLNGRGYWELTKDEKTTEKQMSYDSEGNILIIEPINT